MIHLIRSPKPCSACAAVGHDLGSLNCLKSQTELSSQIRMASFKDVAMRSVNPATKDPQKPQVPKQAKKDNHIKAFKNPSETVVALSLAAAKKADQTIIVLILLSVWAGCRSYPVFLTQPLVFIAIAGAASLTVGGGLQFQTVDRVGNLTFASATQFTLPILPRLGLACTFPV